MAINGIRQLGEPRIGSYADRLRPEPPHVEVNNWAHVLDLIYLESLQREKYHEFIDILK